MSEPLHVYVRRLREAQGRWLSQNELARRAGISPSTVNRLEQGRTSDVKTLRAIAPHLGIRADDLLRRAGRLDMDGEGAPLEPEPDVWAAVAEILARAGYSEEARAAIRLLIRTLAPPSAPTSGSS